jgi:8-oxo-dGTP pyrophosphatase MutT (NUDIX family)
MTKSGCSYSKDEVEYEMPGGGWGQGESFNECLKREFMDEIGDANVGR